MKTWKPCGACGRFIACGERQCPFCGASAPCEQSFAGAVRADRSSRADRLRKAALVAGAAIASASCSSHMVPAYGAFPPVDASSGDDAASDDGGLPQPLYGGTGPVDATAPDDAQLRDVETPDGLASDAGSEAAQDGGPQDSGQD